MLATKLETLLRTNQAQLCICYFLKMIRSMIDLSLEANAQGLKFYKDRYEKMKAELEEQKKHMFKNNISNNTDRTKNHSGQPKASESLKSTSSMKSLADGSKTVSSKNKSAKKRDRNVNLRKEDHVVKQDMQRYKTESEDETSDNAPTYSRSSPGYALPSDTDEDDSDYYNQNDTSTENRLSDRTESLHNSSTSLDESLNFKVEIGCRTNFTGKEQTSKSQPNSRRENVATDHFVTPEDHERIHRWCIEHFGDMPNDSNTCGLTIGVCAVTSRRCAEAGMELRKMLSDAFGDEQNSKLKLCEQKLEQLTQQLKEARSLRKKAEKKTKQEETKNASLLADKLDLEDKLKAARKEVDQLKKKSTEDRNNAKKQKDRDLETIRRLETENAEKDAEREREKGLFEDKLREARTKENKAERERKHAVGNSNAAIERARKAEAAQIELMYELCERRFEKAQEEIHVGMSEAEKNFKRAHNTQDDQDVMKKNLAEWKAASEELEKIMKETKVEYENAAEAVKKGQLLLSQFELNQPTLPALPKTIRLPPVQVVQPSTSALPPPLNIVPPPAGVIGQPRSSTSSVGVGQPSRASGMNDRVATRSLNSMKKNDLKQNEARVQQQVTSTRPTLWNWNFPLENDCWTHSSDDFTAETNNLWNHNHASQSQSVNWSSGSEWQSSSSANISPHSLYGRSGWPPYYQ